MAVAANTVCIGVASERDDVSAPWNRHEDRSDRGARLVSFDEKTSMCSACSTLRAIGILLALAARQLLRGKLDFRERRRYTPKAAGSRRGHF